MILGSSNTEQNHRVSFTRVTKALPPEDIWGDIYSISVLYLEVDCVKETLKIINTTINSERT
jgi:hypothetical protein